MPWFRPIFLIKIVSAIFEIFRKKEAKKKKKKKAKKTKTLFSSTITILDHTPYGKVKKANESGQVNGPASLFI